MGEGEGKSGSKRFGKREKIITLAGALACAAIVAVTLAVLPLINGAYGVDESDIKNPANDPAVVAATGVQDPSGGDGAAAAGSGSGASSSGEDPSVSAGGGQGQEALPPALEDIDPAEIPDYQDAEYERDVVLVELSEGVAGADVVKALDDAGAPGAAVADESGSLLTLSLPEGLTVEQTVALLNSLGVAEGAQPNFVYHLNGDDRFPLSIDYGELRAQASTNDPKAKEQWALQSIKAPQAWDVAKTNGKVTVAVLDDGFLVGHEDLKDNVKATYNAISKGSDVSPAGTSWHGTHVAGIVAARADNGKGVAGVSYNAGLALVKVFNGNTTTSANLISAYDWVIANRSRYNIRVVNMSIGGVWQPANNSDGLLKSIDRAHSLGIVTVCASGNSETARVPYKVFPGDYAKVVNVINIQKDLRRSATSNYNVTSGETTKDISAPGTDICSTYGSKTSSYNYQSGTSMAAPMVSGVLALVFARNPGLTADEAVSLVYSTTTDLGPKGFDQQFGHGEVNAQSAVSAGSYLTGTTSIKKGATTRLTMKGATASSWTTSNPAVATVSGGTVTGKAAGTAVITATSKDGKYKAAQTVSVYDASIAGPATLYTGTGKTYTVNSAVAGSWEWSSSNGNVATVGAASGAVTPKKAGTFTLTARLSANHAVSYSRTITVKALSYSGATRVPVGATTTLSCPGYSLKVVSNGSCGSISGSTFAGKKAGNVTVGIFEGSSQVASRTITVYALSSAYVIQPAASGKFALDISGGSTSNGGNLQLYGSNGTNAQKFWFSYNSDGCYTIKNAKSGKAVDVSGGSKARGANIQQWAPNATAAQRWRVTVDASNRLTFINKGSGMALDLANGTLKNGTNVRQWSQNGSNAQKWTLASTSVDQGAVFQGTYRIASSLNTGRVLDVSGGSRSRGANVQVWNNNWTNAQKWDIVYVGRGLYRVCNVGSGMALDVSGASWGRGANVQQWSWNNTNAQLWKISRNGDGTYTFYRNGSSAVLDVSGGIASNGRNVQQWTSNGTKAQKFHLYQY